MDIRKTKILCTIGPATSGVDNLVRLIKTGMDAARINFSHGSHEANAQLIQDIRKASEVAEKPISIVQDLQGPKIRTSKVKDGAVELQDGAEFIITVEDMKVGNSHKVGTTYKELIDEVKKGNTLLLDDGYIILEVTEITNKDIITKVVKGGSLKDNKGIIAPGTKSNAPTLSQKDLKDLEFGLKEGIDAVALSFVRSERDIYELRTAMKIYGRSVPVIAKIERSEGYEDIDDIVNEADMVMVARGDLGLEMPTEEVPLLQKDIINKCNYYGKRVITATQMLESMISNPRPTRAEASDVANAVIDGSDVVMLSGETSVGRYPFDAVDYMSRIIKSVEKKYYSNITNFSDKVKFSSEHSDALGWASCKIAEQIKASAIIAYTSSSFTASNISKYRPQMPILGITQDPHVQRRLSFIWGVKSVLIPESEYNEPDINTIREELLKTDIVSKGDHVVFVAGLSPKSLSNENTIRIYKV